MFYAANGILTRYTGRFTPLCVNSEAENREPQLQNKRGTSIGLVLLVVLEVSIMKKRILAIVLALAVVLCMSGLVYAATDDEQKVYLKASGNKFEAGWQNEFKVVPDVGDNPQVWHLVYAGQANFANVTRMQLEFIDSAGEQFIWHWTSDMGPSLNPGGNNPGWVIIAPYDWQLVYAKDGAGGKDKSYLMTKDGGNVNFNISGYKKGSGGGGGYYGGLTVDKSIDGMAYMEWWTDHPDVDMEELFSGISFYLYASDKYGAYDPDGARIAGDFEVLSGAIKFTPATQPAEGWYVIVEEFEDDSLAAEFFEDVGPLLIYINAAGSFVFGDATDFDYDAFYTIVNGYGNGYTIGYQGLNNTGDIFPISIKNAATEETYASFCANGGSTAFAGESGLGCTGYMVVDTDEPHGVNKAEFLQAYNYIEDNIGDLAANRAITQIITWYLLGSVDPESAAFDAVKWDTINGDSRYYQGMDAQSDVLEVINNYAGFVGSGKVVDVVFLVCEAGHDFINCQPQLVPIYGGGSFDNKTNPGNFYGMASFTKYKLEIGEDDAILANGSEGFVFDLYMLDEDGDWELIESIPVELDGTVTSSDKLDPGEYKFVEQNAAGWQAFYGADPAADGLYFTITEKGDLEWAPGTFDGDDEDAIVLNKELPVSIRISTETGEWYSKTGSITGGYAGEGKLPRGQQIHNLENKLTANAAVDNGKTNNGNGNNGNNGNGNGNNASENSGNNGGGNGNGGSGPWFQFNDLVGPGPWTFDLVQGDKLTKVGEFKVTYANGKFTLEAFDSSGTCPLEFVGAKLSISNTILFAKNKNDKGFDVNNIWTTSPGQQLFSGSGKSFTVNQPNAVVNDPNKPLYLYMHLEGIKGWINVGDTEFTATVTGPSYPDGEDFPLTLTPGKTKITGSIFLDNLKQGEYTVVVTNKAGVEVYSGTKELVGGDPTWDIWF